MIGASRQLLNLVSVVERCRGREEKFLEALVLSIS